LHVPFTRIPGIVVTIKQSSKTASHSMTDDTRLDWTAIARNVLVSRAIDEIEETRLYKEGKVLYQFSARGHDVAQSILGALLTHPHDAASAYYRSRPLMLSIGLDIEDAFAAPMAKSGGFSDGRDIGVVCNMPGNGRATVLPMGGDVGSQYTPAAGWAQAITYRRDQLGEDDWAGAIAVVLGGEGSVATNGFWSALTIATTLELPMLFYVEDNGYALSVPSDKQTPGRNIAENLASFKNLEIIDTDGTDPELTADGLRRAVGYVREGKGACMIRLTLPRLSGHSGQDTQAYKGKELIAEERANDPLTKLRDFLVPERISEAEWEMLENDVSAEVSTALDRALAREEPDPETITRYVFAETTTSGDIEVQTQGGVQPDAHVFPDASETPEPEETRVNMLTAIRRTLEAELSTNDKLLVFGEDVGPKGGVHAATMGLQQRFGEARVFDTSLSEEGIIGRAVGMAAAGLVPAPEIQFRKYADPATEQLNNCGTMRWRTANRFASPVVVRLPGGFFKCGDPWHSVSSEVTWAHAVGWQIVMPSNAEDAAGLLRAALRSPNPTVFFEHRHLLDASCARRPYPGDRFIVPIGKARHVTTGDELTIVTWGAMVDRCERAAKETGHSVEIVDLRTIMPWDREAVLASVRKTHRCLVVHEDTGTAGLGAEVCAVVGKEAFFDLDAPLERITTPDVPIPYNVGLMNAVLPSVDRIASTIREMIAL
jgi:2-oxoisovalerate dehydrogenase E1 component